MSWDPEFLKQFAPSADKWKCPICLVLNDKDSEKCRSCENPNPNIKISSKKRKAGDIEEPASKVAKTNPSSLFNFGAAQSTSASTSSNIFNFGTATTTAPAITPNLFKFGVAKEKKEEVKKDDEEKTDNKEEEKKEEDKKKEDKSSKSKKPTKEKTSKTSKECSSNLYVMGSNDLGQLGLTFEDEDEYEAKIPTLLEIPNCKSIIQICCGTVHCLALSNEGIVYSWGCNDKGALGREGDEKKPLPILSQYFNDSKIKALSCGNSHSAVLNENGEIYSWGIYQDDHGDIGYDEKHPKEMKRPNKNCKKVVYLKSGGDFTVFIDDKGKIYGMGNNEQLQLGRKTSDRLKKKNLTPNIITIPPQNDKNKKCKSIYCGVYHCICIMENGNVYGWGQNTSGQLGIGDYDNRTKPSLITFYNNENDGKNIKKAKEFACGMHFTICLCEDGSVYGCGSTSYGKLGLGELRDDENSKPIPTKIPKLSSIESIAAGSEHSLAINNKGELFCWGFNESWQLGTGEDHDELEPRKLDLNGKKVMKISCGTQHSGFITEI